MQGSALSSLLSISFLMAAVGPLEGCREDMDLGGNQGPDGATQASDGSQSADGTVRGPSEGGRDAPSDGSPSTCAPVTFRMQAPAGDGGYSYVSGEYSLALLGNASWWYFVTTADGKPVPTFVSPATAVCEDCFLLGNLPVGPGTCFPLPDGGATATWSGNVVTGSSTCDATSEGRPIGAVSCSIFGCVTAGQYVATMCAFALDDCLVADGGSCPSASADNACLASLDGGVCVSVPFEYPTTAEVVGTLPP
jgi:hypothetical protein